MMATLSNEIVAEARCWIGTPYVHQASCRGAGADCLGLIRGIWREIYGDEPCHVPPYTADWAEVSRQEELWQAASRWLIQKSLNMAAPGDVVLFRIREHAVAKHLGVQTTIGHYPSFIHAYSGHHVRDTALTVPWERRIAARFSFPEKAQRG